MSDQVSVLKDRCEELNKQNTDLRARLKQVEQSNLVTTFHESVVVNPETNKIEFFHTVAIISENQVFKTVHRGVLNNETNEVKWVKLEDTFSE